MATNDKRKTRPAVTADRGVAASGAPDLLRDIVRLIEREGNTTAVFGAPIKFETRTIVPIAAIEMGAGGGVGFIRPQHEPGRDAHLAERIVALVSRATGGGGGASIKIRPVGYLHEENGRVVFTKIDAGGTER